MLMYGPDASAAGCGPAGTVASGWPLFALWETTPAGDTCAVSPVPDAGLCEVEALCATARPDIGDTIWNCPQCWVICAI